MLIRADLRLPSRQVLLFEADALRLPVATDSLDLLTTAFGFRNLANYRSGLVEFHRVLKHGGELGILDFSEPSGSLGKIYNFYFHKILPKVGALVSGTPQAYRYLPSSVVQFPVPPQFLEEMRQAGFDQASWTPYNFGVAGLYRGIKR
jgi:demethylmenaquinone methyltransferase/2-methoxy-6-polyprenyl-1,4-benzoquinol methylase